SALAQPASDHLLERLAVAAIAVFAERRGDSRFDRLERRRRGVDGRSACTKPHPDLAVSGHRADRHVPLTPEPFSEPLLEIAEAQAGGAERTGHDAARADAAARQIDQLGGERRRRRAAW